MKEHCMFFKEIVDAARFRREVNERFECATLPGVPRERIKKLLKFVVIGAGPTGVELAASCTIRVPRCGENVPATIARRREHRNNRFTRKDSFNVR